MATADVFVPVNMNSQKITGLANGSNPGDAAAFGQIPSVPVSSVFGRTGAVVGATGDYTAAQVGALAAAAAAGGDLTGNYPNPTLVSRTLDAIAAAHATAADWSNNSHKITSLANGAAAQDAAAFGQIPTALPPNGAAGGSLAGTYPNPTIAQAQRARGFLAESLFGSSIIAESINRYDIATNLSVLSTGRLSCASVDVLSGDVISSVGFHSATTALAAQTNWWFALCDASFSVIRQSTDQTNTGSWGSNSPKTLTVDSVPVTAGARVASSTVTLTFPTLSQALSAIFTAGDSIVVSNANIAAYNGTFTVATVGASTITYVSGGSATDSLAAPFPTVQPAAGKRTYTVPANGIVYCVVMVKGTVPTLASNTPNLAGFNALTPIVSATGDTALTGTCPSPIAHGTGLNAKMYCGVL